MLSRCRIRPWMIWKFSLTNAVSVFCFTSTGMRFAPPFLVIELTSTYSQQWLLGSAIILFSLFNHYFSCKYAISFTVLIVGWLLSQGFASRFLPTTHTVRSQLRLFLEDWLLTHETALRLFSHSHFLFAHPPLPCYLFLCNFTILYCSLSSVSVVSKVRGIRLNGISCCCYLTVLSQRSIPTRKMEKL